jgi:hypothetical protein
MNEAEGVCESVEKPVALSGPMRRRPALRTTLSLALAAATLAVPVAGCGGGDDDGGEPVAQDLTTVYCPMERVGREAGVPQFEPAENAFDTSELIGLDLDGAGSLAAEHGCEIIVSVADGEGQPVPIEINLKAIYVYTEDDVVTQIEGVGGGI